MLKHHYPAVPNWGDITKFKEWPDANVDVLVGGTPCQSFSIAGLRKGLDDPRGNLTLVYLAIAARYRPRWVVWENVTGVLSDDGGRTFGTFLGGLGQLGYGFAYRVLDAQFAGLAQRRKRVFVVGHLGDWRRAASVFLEREGLRGDPAPSRKERQDVAGTLGGSSQTGGFRTTDLDNSGAFIPVGGVAKALGASTGGMSGKAEHHTFVDSRGQPLNALGFSCKDYGQDAEDELVPTMRAMNHDGSHANAGGQLAVAFGNNNTSGPIEVSGAVRAKGGSGHGDFESETFVFESRFARNGRGAPEEICPPLKAQSGETGKGDAAPLLMAPGTGVRRLTPRECERLQGFPDGYTQVPYRGKAAADGPRYKALGNSMAVPVMGQIGRRITLVDKL